MRSLVAACFFLRALLSVAGADGIGGGPCDPLAATLTYCCWRWRGGVMETRFAARDTTDRYGVGDLEASRSSSFWTTGDGGGGCC